MAFRTFVQNIPGIFQLASETFGVLANGATRDSLSADISTILGPEAIFLPGTGLQTNAWVISYVVILASDPFTGTNRLGLSLRFLMEVSGVLPSRAADIVLIRHPGANPEQPVTGYKYAHARMVRVRLQNNTGQSVIFSWNVWAKVSR